MQIEPEGPDNAKLAEMVTMCVCLNLRKASRAVTQVFDEALRPCGLRSTQLPVLVTLALAGSMTITNLADELVMDRTSLARLLGPLEIGGFISIAPGADRRTRELSVSIRGLEAVEKAVPLWEKAQAHVVKKLGERRWRYLLTGLHVAALVPRSSSPE